MPKHARKQRKKRNSKRSIGRYRNKSMSGVPAKLHVKLRYQQNVSLSGVTLETQRFRMNSLFDPDSTGTGQQPQGFDELAAIYTRYKVNACRMRVTYYNEAGKAVNVITTPSTGATNYSDIQSIATAPQAKCDLLTAAGGSRDRVIHTLYQKPKSAEGWPTNPQGLAASTGANPEFLWYAHCAVGNAGANTTAVDVSCQMVYYVTFFDPKRLDIS